MLSVLAIWSVYLFIYIFIYLFLTGDSVRHGSQDVETSEETSNECVEVINTLQQGKPFFSLNFDTFSVRKRRRRKKKVNIFFQLELVPEQRE